MKTTDEYGTIVYFNIPHDAVVTASENEIVINLISNEQLPVGTIVGKHSGVKSFMRFGKVSSTLRRSPNYFYLQDNEFALLQKEVEQQFAKSIPAPPVPPGPRNIKGETPNV